MRTILFIPASASGHIIATFRIAKILKDTGYKVTYLVDTNMIKLVQEQEFETITCKTYLFYNNTVGGIFDQLDKKLPDRIMDRITNSTLNATIKNLRLFEDTIDKIAPDQIIMDVFLSYNYILLKNKRPTTFIQTQLSTYKDTFIAPLTSSLLPNNKLLIKLEWLKCKLIRQWRRVYYCWDGQWDLTQRVLKKLNRSFDFSQLNWEKCFHVGIRGIPEWVTSPAEFDFPREKAFPFQKHIGPTTDINRKEVHDAQYDKWVEKTADKKIAYCSLGTISGSHNNKSVDVLKKIALAFSTKRDWELLISCGDVDVNQLGVVSPNIHLLKRVPQLDVIKRSNLVIHHGGINTVMECILLGVPMLSLPLSNKWDLNGTTARIVYHKLGLKCNPFTMSVAELHKKVDEIMGNLIYKENVEKMRLIFQQRSDAFEATILQELGLEKPTMAL
jgi:zeaxanthin glucosyltransferase